jgi:uncharacterized NAD(P)/FAD-binding protein YdhS
MSILNLFCSVDELWQQFAPWWQRQLLASGARRRLRRPRPTWTVRLHRFPHSP